MQKKCFKCEKVKPIEGFYKHSKMLDGHLNKCKECAKVDVKIHRRDNDHVREHDRERAKTIKRKEHITENTRVWRKLYPEKYKAHAIVSNAVRSGKLIKRPCEKCGALKVHAHHKDYSKPLEVNWYCARCHSKEHNPEDY